MSVSKEAIEAAMKSHHGDDVYDLWRDKDIGPMEDRIRSTLRAAIPFISSPARTAGRRWRRYGR